jgi:NodT family efflux transporter outer membrane factor (OMF) lipoprotein
MCLVGCMPVREQPELASIEAKQWQHSARPASTEPVDLRGWWKSFRDPQLDALVDEALTGNAGLERALQRLQQVHTLTRHAGDAYRPQVSLSTRSVQEVSATDTYFQVSLDAIWELGFFGEREAAQTLARGDSQAAMATLQAARVTVVSEVVRQYVELQTAGALIDTLQQLAELERQSNTLMQVRVDTRLGNLDELAQGRARYAQAQAALSTPRETQARAEQALQALLGRECPDPQWRLSKAPGPLHIGALQQVPSDLLQTRPDVQAAEAEVWQAAGQLGVARAKLYPRIAIGTSYLYAYNLTQNQQERLNDLPMLGPLIDVPLLDWGRRKAAADAQRHALDAAVAGYRDVVRTAVAQTETALAVLEQSRERLHHLRDAQVTLRGRDERIQTLTELGLASKWDGLGSQREALNADLQATQAQLHRSLAFIALYKSLGGAPLRDVSGQGES